MFSDELVCNAALHVCPFTVTASIFATQIELKKGKRGSLWSSPEGRHSEWNQNDLLALGIDVSLSLLTSVLPRITVCF